MKRVVLITGVNGLIGQRLVFRFLDEGYDVIGLDIGQVNPAIKDLCSYFELNLQDVDKVRRFCRFGLRDFGSIDVLVHAAAMKGGHKTEGWDVGFQEQDPTLWEKCFAINVTSFFTLVQELHQKLLGQDGASVIAISSIYGSVGPRPEMYREVGFDNPAGYAASKGALEQVIRWLSTEVSHGIRVNGVAPGGVFQDHDSVFEKRYASHTPMQRMANVDEVVDPVIFLASSGSRYMTGQILMVDGGFSVW